MFTVGNFNTISIKNLKISRPVANKILRVLLKKFYESRPWFIMDSTSY